MFRTSFGGPGYELYLDNSMNLKKVNFTNYDYYNSRRGPVDKDELHPNEGFNAHPLVDGGVFLVDKQFFYGFAASHTKMINMFDDTNFELLMARHTY